MKLNIYLINKYNGKGYDGNGNIIYELKNGNGKVKEYKKGELIFEGEYLNGIKWNGKGHRLLARYELNQGKGYIKLKNYNYFFFRRRMYRRRIKRQGKNESLRL